MLDTKSKSSKKFSFLLAGILVAASAAVFLAFYPVMGEQAGYHYSDYLKSDQFLYDIYQGNLVLNKQILDKTGHEEVSYADLYLTINKEQVTEEEMNGEIDAEVYVGAELVKGQLNEMMNDVMENWEDSVLGGLAQYMDYCVIDHGSGEIIKNTGRNIDTLYRNKPAGDLEKTASEEDYVYYVMITYDGTGSVSNISVRDERSDELLKKVQSGAAARWLKNSFESAARGILWSHDAVYVYNSMGELEKLVCHVNDRPKDMTFIYALTKEQKENILNMVQRGGSGSFFFQYQREVRDAYYQAGAPGIYWIILIVLGILALVCTRLKRYCLHTLPSFQAHLEVSLAGIFIVFGVFVYFVVQLMYFTNSGYFPEIYNRYMGFVEEAFYPVLTGVINAAVMFLFFGIWYYLITSFGEVFDIGVKEFILKRSLIINFIRWIAGGCKKKTNQFKEEILHMDLGGKTEKTIMKLLAINFLILAAACTMWVGGYAALIIYTFVAYFLIKKYIGIIQEQYRKLFAATRSIAEGNLQTELSQDWGVFESYKEELSKIQNGFKAAVDKEVRSQRMKTELITNVSHDLKTPLTAITTYIELLEDENLTPEVRREYLGVLKKKSGRLKFLIEDLFEVSKASSGNVTLNLVEVDICNLMRQVYLEYEDKVEEADLIFRFRMPEEKVVLQLDSQKTYRVFENLYVNIIKYAMPHTRVYVNVEKTEKEVSIELKNMSACELNVRPEELTERFVRGDASRNTEGSGLGLAIARSFVELQKGSLSVEIDGDLFKVVIRWEQTSL